VTVAVCDDTLTGIRYTTLKDATYWHETDRALKRETQNRLAHDDSPEVRSRVAETTSYRDLLDLLIGDAEPEVRGMAAANPRIDRQQMEKLITDPIARVRINAVNLGWHYPDDGQLLRLASDRSSRVRWSALYRPGSPRALYELLANDADEYNSRAATHWLAGGSLHSSSVVQSQDAMSARAIPGEFEKL
jgi:hypothetical protein